MGSLIMKRKAPDYDENPPMPCQDPVVHLEHLFQESVDTLEREQASPPDAGELEVSDFAEFEKALIKVIQAPVVQKNEEMLKRREQKIRHWMGRMMADPQTDWDVEVARVKARDPQAGALMQKVLSAIEENLK